MPQKKLTTIKQKLAFTTVEIVLAISIFSMVVLLLAAGVSYGIGANHEALDLTKANYLLDESFEALANIREAGFNNLTAGTYGLTTTGNIWNLSGSSDTTNNFTRTVTITNVDADTKDASVNISWTRNVGPNKSVSATSRLTNWLRTISTMGNWALPSVQVPTVPAITDLTGTTAASRVEVFGQYAYFLKASGSPNFFIFDISDPLNPVAKGTYSVPANAYDFAVTSNRAYITSSANSNEITILDLTNQSTSIPGVSLPLLYTYNAPNSTDANGIAVNGNYLYYLRSTNSTDHEFNVLDITNIVAGVTPYTPIPLGTADTSGNLLNITFNTISGSTYAYVTQNSTSSEFLIYNVTTPSAVTLTRTVNLSGSASGSAVYVVGNRAYVSELNSTVYMVNITTPATASEVTTYAAGGNVSGISSTTDGSYLFLGTANTSREFQTVVVNPTFTTMTYSGSVNLSANLNSVVYLPLPIDRVIGATSITNNEMIFFKPA